MRSPKAYGFYKKGIDFGHQKPFINHVQITDSGQPRSQGLSSYWEAGRTPQW